MRKLSWKARSAVGVLLVGVLVYTFLWSGPAGAYEEGIPRLGMNSTAHLMCSCLFNSENPEDFCREYAQLKQVNPKIKIDWEKKKVTATVYWIFSGSAIHLGQHEGCRVL